MFTINKNGLSYGRGYVYSLQYHLVWCTKYRKKVLKDGTRYVFVQNFSREAVEVKLPIERYPVWQGTYDGTIGSWKTIVLKGR